MLRSLEGDKYSTGMRKGPLNPERGSINAVVKKNTYILEPGFLMERGREGASSMRHRRGSRSSAAVDGNHAEEEGGNAGKSAVNYLPFSYTPTS